MHNSVIFCPPRELLSPQQHYDWGLRALKTVLRGCGHFLAQEKTASQKSKTIMFKWLHVAIDPLVSG